MQKVQLLRDNYTNTGSISKLREGDPDIVISLKAAGDMKLGSDQRPELLLHMQIAPERFYGLHQVHSQKVLISGPGVTDEVEGDGLVAGNPEHVLGVSVADCMPIFLYHTPSRRYAVVHSGWRGTGIAVRAVDLLDTHFNIPAEELTAVLGPSIRSCCDKVDSARAQNFSDAWGTEAVQWRASSETFDRASSEAPQARQPFLDLLYANSHSLEERGVQDIRYIDECTACSDEFGSFRREGPGVFTHMLAMIGYFK